MADVLGPWSGKGRPESRATCGGECKPKELPYSPPVGPKGQMEKGVGLHGTNMGNCGTQGKR